jgi:hypothetical protein
MQVARPTVHPSYGGDVAGGTTALHGGVLAGSVEETADACTPQRGVATCTAAWRLEHGGGRPCSGEVATVASKLTMALASMTHGDAKNM